VKIGPMPWSASEKKVISHCLSTGERMEVQHGEILYRYCLLCGRDRFSDKEWEKMSGDGMFFEPEGTYGMSTLFCCAFADPARLFDSTAALEEEFESVIRKVPVDPVEQKVAKTLRAIKTLSKISHLAVAYHPERVELKFDPTTHLFWRDVRESKGSLRSVMIVRRDDSFTYYDQMILKSVNADNFMEQVRTSAREPGSSGRLRIEVVLSESSVDSFKRFMEWPQSGLEYKEIVERANKQLKIAHPNIRLWSFDCRQPRWRMSIDVTLW
jgi:hypothetical protein